MGMFLSGTPVYMIMLMGRWSSDSFMRYIHKQVLSLSHGIAKKMLTYEQFFTVPDFVHTAADGDNRHHSNTNLASTTNFNGSHANMRPPSYIPLKSLISLVVDCQLYPHSLVAVTCACKGKV
jgi:hypothetical protein